MVDFRGLDQSLSCAGEASVASGGSEDEQGGVQEFTANNDKIVQGSSWFWLLTNSDEVNLNSQKIDRKVDKLNAGSLGCKTCYRKETG